jgi:bifunctional NMN adenylyltransferase/nudix hydrolase
VYKTIFYGFGPMSKINSERDSIVFDFIVVIGRFQPFHKGHESLVRQALAQAKYVIILVGSVDMARSTKNPWTWRERVAMIERTFPAEFTNDRISVLPIDDNPYDDEAWVADVRRKVDGRILYLGNRKNDGSPGGIVLHGTRDFKTGLLGHDKDASSFYLKLFPEWVLIPVEAAADVMHATELRYQLFTQGGVVASSLPDPVTLYLRNWRDEAVPQTYDRLCDEQHLLNNYKAAWAKSPYPPTFVTADALIRHHGKILLITRKTAPGENLLAMPGGFVNSNETVRQAQLRELGEETGLASATGLSLTQLGVFREVDHVFDHPDRDLRGRMITHAALFEVPDHIKLKTQAADDASASDWYNFMDLDPTRFFADHWHMIYLLLDKASYGGFDRYEGSR